MRAQPLGFACTELGEVERLLAASDGGIVGACRACGAVHSRRAVFCWQCGQPLLPGAVAESPPVPAER